MIGVLSVYRLSVAVCQSMCSNLLHCDEAWLVQQVPCDGDVHPDRNGDDRCPVGGDNPATRLFDDKEQLLGLCREGMRELGRVRLDVLNAFRETVIDPVFVQKGRGLGEDENVLRSVVSHVGGRSRRW